METVMANPHALPIILPEADRVMLESWTRRPTTAPALALRTRIVLACAMPGVTNSQVAEQLGVSRPTVIMWRRRYAERGPSGLVDAPRPGARRRISDVRLEPAAVTT